ncbi:MAG: hypothetical protein AAF141_05605 [Pseudomonadota bacterium]
MKPTPERLRHSEGGLTLVMSKDASGKVVSGQIVDVKGQIGVPAGRVRSTVEVMHDNGTLDDREYEAACQFAEEYQRAMRSQDRAIDPSHVGGGTWSNAAIVAMCDASATITLCANMLGGWTSPDGRLAEWVIGQEYTLADFCKLEAIHRSTGQRRLKALCEKLADYWRIT